MRGKRKLKVHWVDGVEEEKKNGRRSREECPEMGRTRKKRTMPENGEEEDKTESKETGRCSMYF